MNSALENTSGGEFRQSKIRVIELMRDERLLSAPSCTEDVNINNLSLALTLASVNLRTYGLEVNSTRLLETRVMTSNITTSRKTVGQNLRDHIENIESKFNIIKDRCTSQNSPEPNNTDEPE